MKSFKLVATRVLALLMVLSMLMLVSCDNTNTSTDSSSSSDSSEAASEGGNSSEGSSSIPDDEYTLEREEGHNQLTLYWNHSGTYENCDIWIWYGDVAGKGYTFHECAYGAKVVVNIPEGIDQVGFIVRKDCSEPGGSSWGTATKDFDQDRFAVLEGTDTFIYLKSGDGSQYTSKDGGKTLEMIKKFAMAGMVDFNTIYYSVTPKITISDLSQIKVFDGDREVAVKSISSMGKASTDGKVVVEERLDLSKIYEIEIEGYGKKAVVPTDIFDSKEFVDNYTYSGNDLGAVINGNKTTFKVWAPTATKVVLNLFEKGNDCDAYKNVDMTKGEKGVWSYTEECGHGTYYTYSVTTSVGTQEATDPYAKAAGVNGNRSMVVDLSTTNPEGWKSEFKTGIDSYSDAVIWEVHVRDFSNKIDASKYKGKYLAFTETGLKNSSGVSVGIDYLVNLGITHVHLLPVYDYATVDEANPDKEFNWGYDPKNYNVPEGSYSTDPFNGDVRIREYKQMVQALHNAGIGVVMDVVYNHTYDGNSSFNRIVPYYYYRYTSTGANSSASGCGNDTASERYMFGKFMVDSVSYWAEEYDLDGFRFDLMGLHDLETMKEVEAAVHAINPEAIIYGEGWTMGHTIDGSAQANQGNISQIKPTGNGIGGVAVFNDAMRDGLKGSVFDKASQGFINGASSNNLAKVIFGMKGGVGIGMGWAVDNAMVVNYMSAHDNNTLWDKLLLSNPTASDDLRNKMNNLGAAILLVSKGTPFWQAGEEMLRTKDGDENSYKSSDAINNINWEVLKEGNREYSTMLYYKGLIEMRKSFGIFSDVNSVIDYTSLTNGIVAVSFTTANGEKALAVINPNNVNLPYNLDGEWNLVADSTRAGGKVLAKESGSVTVEGISIRVYVNDTLAK